MVYVQLENPISSSALAEAPCVNVYYTAWWSGNRRRQEKERRRGQIRNTTTQLAIVAASPASHNGKLLYTQPPAISIGQTLERKAPTNQPRKQQQRRHRELAACGGFLLLTTWLRPSRVSKERDSNFKSSYQPRLPSFQRKGCGTCMVVHSGTCV